MISRKFSMNSHLSVKGRVKALGLFTIILLISLAGASVILAGDQPAFLSNEDVVPREMDANCNLLDDPQARSIMSGMFETKLLIACGREDELGAVSSLPFEGGPQELLGLDVQVNDSSGDSGASTTQSETSIALNEDTGTLCSGYNDSYHGVVQGNGYTGFSRSIDGGMTFVDGGALSSSSFGDPSVYWRRADGYFYFAALHSSGLGMWRSTDDCASFTFLAMIHSGGGDDKELMAIDNDPVSPYYGRIYVAWTDFSAGARIFSTYSDNGTSWSTPVALSDTGADVQGAWPTVAPGGDVYVGWVRWNPYPTGPNDIEIARSTDGGVSYNLVTNPLSGAVNPRDSAATGNCGRPALNGNIRYLPSPQLDVSPNGDLHVVYSYDPDGFGTGDVVDVFYRRSTDSGATWDPEIRLSDDTTLTDQYFPTVSVGPTGRVVATWYDRRLDDTSNYLQDYFMAVSHDGGSTWQANKRVSDVSTPIYIDPNLAACYHGDYDTQVQDAAFGYIQWSDDRNIQGGHNDPDVWFDRDAFFPDFLLEVTPESQGVCAPASVDYDVLVDQILGFTDPVTLSASGVPTGYSAGFSVNPVIPPGSSVMTLSQSGTPVAGSYNIDVVGVAPTSTHTVTVGFDIFDDVPTVPTLLTPPDGATNVELVPTFEWTGVSQSDVYYLEVATDSGFTNVVYSTTLETTDHTLNIALDPLTMYYWHVMAENPCGSAGFSATFSFETRPIPPILLVDDDDNSPDVRSYYTDALDGLGMTYDIWDTENSDNEPDLITLLPYDIVIWFTGDEFGGFAGPGASGESALSGWLDTGTCLFLSSQDYHYDRGLTTFMDTYLGASSVTDDNGDYGSVTGQGAVFGGLGPFGLTYPFTDYSDTIQPDGDAEVAWVGDNANNAAVDKDSGVYRTTFWVYPFEALGTPTDRQDVMNVVLNWCGAGVSTGTLEGTVSDVDSGLGIEGATITADDGVSPRMTSTNADGDYSLVLPIGSYDVTAEATNYVSQTVVSVEIFTDTITVQDFALQGSLLSFSPGSIHEVMEIGDVVTNTVTVTNTGPLPIDWSVAIGGYGGPNAPTVKIEVLSVDELAQAAGAAPARAAAADGSASSYADLADGLEAQVVDGQQALSMPANPSMALTIYSDRASFDADFPGLPLEDFEEANVPPGGVVVCNSPINSNSNDACFLPGDIIPGVDIQDNPLYIEMVALGSGLIGNPTKVVGPNTFVDFLELEFTTSDTYGAGMLALNNAPGIPVPIEIYALDGTTLLGSSVVTPDSTGVFWGVGSTEPIGKIIFLSPNGDLIDDLAFGGGGGAGSGWASAVPNSGTIPSNSTATFEVVFDASSLISVGDYTAQLSFAGTFVNDVPDMPLTMTVGCPTCGFLDGSIYDSVSLDPLVSNIQITGPGGFDVNLSGDSYALAVQPGTYDFEVNATGYLSATASVVATQGVTTTTDFYLDPAVAMIAYTPPSIYEAMEIGDIVTNTVTVTNTGYVPLEWNASIGGYGGPDASPPDTVSLPASNGIFPLGAAAPSLERPPESSIGKVEPRSNFSIEGLGAAAYGIDLLGDLFVTFDLDTATNLTTISSMAGNFYAGDFLNGDFSQLYVLDDATDILYSANTATGVLTAIGSSVPSGGQTWTGLAGDPTSGTLYGSSSDCSNNTIYTIDVATGAVTVVGTETGYCLIDIAINAAGQMYSVDILADLLVSVDKSTGTVTPIGSIGFDANFAQSMDFDEDANILYLAAYNNALGAAELRMADVNTGATTLISSIGAGAGVELDAFAIATGGGGQGGWASAVPDSGTILPGNSATFNVIFDASSLYQVGDFTAELSFSGNFVNSVPVMPLTMSLTCPTCGLLEGAITDDWTGLPLTADMHITGPGGFEVFLTADSYALAVQPGFYDFTVTADGYLTATETVEAIAGVTTVTDIALTPAVAILEYDPSSIEMNVLLGGSKSETLVIENTGTIPFDFSLSDTELEMRDGDALNTTCPPDAFGYTCIDSDEVGGPTFEWMDISSTGTNMSLTDDSYFFPIDLPFTFNFYGTDYTQVAVGSNGTVYFEDAYLGLANTTIPSSNSYGVNAYIAVYWDDLNPSTSGAVYYEVTGIAPNRSLVVQWEQVAHFGGTDTITVQAILFEGSNNILVQYLDPSDEAGSGATEGIQGDTSTGLLYGFDSVVLAPDLAICYVYPGATDPNCGGAVDAPWATEVPDSGTIMPGESMDISIIFDASTFTQTGVHAALLHFAGTFDNDVDSAMMIMTIDQFDWYFAPLIVKNVDMAQAPQEETAVVNQLPVASFALLPALLGLGSMITVLKRKP